MQGLQGCYYENSENEEEDCISGKAVERRQRDAGPGHDGYNIGGLATMHGGRIERDSMASCDTTGRARPFSSS